MENTPAVDDVVVTASGVEMRLKLRTTPLCAESCTTGYGKVAKGLGS